MFRRMKEGEIPEEKKHAWKGAYQVGVIEWHLCTAFSRVHLI